MTTTHKWFTAASPMGAVYVAHGDNGISALSLAEGSDAAGFAALVRKTVGVEVVPDDGIDSGLVDEVGAALEQGRSDLAVDLSSCSSFQRSVLVATAAIPRGEVRTYGEIAEAIGRQPNAARAVGNALARNPVPLLVPCHRVVPTGSGIGNYAYGAERKAALLDREGVLVSGS